MSSAANGRAGPARGRASSSLIMFLFAAGTAPAPSAGGGSGSSAVLESVGAGPLVVAKTRPFRDSCETGRKWHGAPPRPLFALTMSLRGMLPQRRTFTEIPPPPPSKEVGDEDSNEANVLHCGLSPSSRRCGRSSTMAIFGALEGTGKSLETAVVRVCVVVDGVRGGQRAKPK
jgi:hypothetical protein